MAKFIVTAFNPANGQHTRLHYDNATSELISESGEPMVQTVEVAARENAPAFSKQTPLAKTSPRVLKISLGLSCNYACEYCSQRFVPRADETNPGNVQAFIDGLDSWVTSPPEKVEFWGGEPLVYIKTMRPLAEAIRAKFPNAELSVITNGSLLNDEINDWLDRMGFSVGISHDGPGQPVRGPDPLHDPEQRAAIMALYARLIEQNYTELKKLWPQAPAGIYSAGLKQRDIHARILFAGIQSIHKRVYDVQQCDLVLIDEAHLIPRSSNTMYRRFLSDLARLNPQMKVIGLTATPYRLDSGLLHEGDDAIFTDIAYEVSVRELIDQGYLSPLISKRMATQIDLTGVGTRGGEFIAKDLEAAVDKDSITQAAVDEIFSYGKDRKSWLIFCAGVDHAYHVRDAIRARGVSCETIVGDTPGAQRESIINDFKAGRIQCLTNANVLTTGFNAPGVDLLAMLRPTKSAGLYVQIVGRGCRLAPGKTDCLVLDFAGNIARHGPIDAVKPKRPKGGEDGVAPTKACPECDSIVHASVRTCPDCGHVFPPPELKLEAKASNLDILTSGKSEWIPVTRVSYARHDKPGKPPSLRVDYWSGLTHHSEWICIEHQGYPRQKAASWWANRAQGLPLPRRVDEAIACAAKLRCPSEIAVRPSGRYTEIVGARFS